MRRHDNIGYDAFNSYRSGDENSRRSDYGSSESNPRGGQSVYGRSSRDIDASDHNFSTDPGFYGSGYSSRNQGQQQPSSQNRPHPESNRYNQVRSQNQGSWSQQNSNQPYGNRISYNTPSNMYRGENRSWQEGAEERMGRWDDKINNAWERWDGDDDNRVRQNWMQHPDHYPTYSHGNAYSNRYSENYDRPYDYRNENRNEYRGNRNEDEGFFENLGNRISNAWDRWVGDDRDEERRYQQRSRYGNSGNSSSGSRSGQQGSSYRNNEYDW